MINVCVIGLGLRSLGLIKSVLLNNPDVKITAVCDVYEDRIEAALTKIRDHGQEAKGFKDYKEALNTAGLDAACVFTGWEMHAEIAVYAMEKVSIMEIDHRRDNAPVSVDTRVEDLMTMAIEQNFVPVVDDRNSFIGIITRRAIIQYCMDHYVVGKEKPKKAEPFGASWSYRI